MKRLLIIVALLSLLTVSTDAKTSKARARRAPHTTAKKAPSPVEKYREQIAAFQSELAPAVKSLSDRIGSLESARSLKESLPGADVSPLTKMLIGSPDDWLEAIRATRTASAKFRTVKQVPTSLKAADNHFVEFSLGMDRALDRYKAWIFSQKQSDFSVASEILKGATDHYTQGSNLLRKGTDPAVRGKVYTQD